MSIFPHVAAIALHESLVRTMKKLPIDNFQAFVIVFDHVNACTSMHSLVEIHNRQVLKELQFYFKLLICSIF